MKTYTLYPSPVGELVLLCGETHVLGVWSPGSHPLPPDAVPGSHPLLDQTAAWLSRYFSGEQPDPRELPLRPQGTPFRELVWQLLLEIPYGKTATYGALAREAARRLGKARMSAQAVGGAVGANPIWIIIPCHRCLGSDGSLTGFRGGLEMKSFLLKLENPDR